MNVLTDENYKDILENHFKKNDIVICGVTPTPGCPDCMATHQNAQIFATQHPNIHMNFYLIDASKYDCLQSFYEFTLMNIYPKIVIYQGSWDNKDFVEGRISVKKFEEIYGV